MTKGTGRQSHLDNRANQLNPSHSAYYASRGQATPDGSALRQAGLAQGDTRRAPETQQQFARDNRAAQIGRARQSE
jgi:hypothetical protein